MHVRDDRVYQFAELLYPYLLDSDMYVGEMDLDIRVASGPVEKYDLRTSMQPKAYVKLEAQIRKYFNLDLAAFGSVHPMLILSAISQRMLETDHQVSLDEHLWHYAKDNGKPVSGLESYAEQLKILHSIDPVPLYRQLQKIANRPSGFRRQTHKAMAWYGKGDIHHLYRMTKASMHGLRKQVIYQRNVVMAARILELDKTCTHFIAIGAGHLSGKCGLLALLKKQGYRTRPQRL